MLGKLQVNGWQRSCHDDVVKWKHFPRYWSFVLGIHRSSMNSPHKWQWRGALMFSLIYACIHGWVNTGEASDVRHHRAHYYVTTMFCTCTWRAMVSWTLSAKLVATESHISDNKSILVLLMVWYRQATSHYLSHCWSRFMPSYGNAKDFIWQHWEL